MLTVTNTSVMNFEGAIRGARNPLASWDKADSAFYKYLGKDDDGNDMIAELEVPIIGENDMGLLKRLRNAGDPSHRKFMRQIMVCADIEAPLYWWKEADQYKISTVTDSCSTMHTIHKKEFTMNDFSHEHLTTDESDEALAPNEFSGETYLLVTISGLNAYRKKYLETKDKRYWWQMIQLLPSSYNQKRTWTGNYENLAAMYHQRKNHKLDEWHQFCEWIETLPYAEELIIGGEKI